MSVGVRLNHPRAPTESTGSIVTALLLAVNVTLVGGCSSSIQAPAIAYARSAIGPESARLSGFFEPEAVLRAMTAVADWQLTHPSKHRRDEWHVAPFWVGLVSFAQWSADPEKYLEAARRNGRRNDWKAGPRPFFADDDAITQSYFMLYMVDGDPRFIGSALARFDEMMRQPFDESLEFSYDKTMRAWVWCDALFMSPPALAQAARVTGDRRYADLMSRLWWKTTDHLYDRAEHLYYRDSRFFARRERNGAKVFWSRGNGWVLAGLARVLQYVPDDYPGRPRFTALFEELAGRIATLQGPDGYWRASLLDPDSWPGPETSGTAFFTYALAWGVNEGLLDRDRYEPVVRKGWSALVRAVEPGGMLGYVQSPDEGPGEAAPGHTEIYGSGAFLLAGSEVYRLAVRTGR
jgi:rhamnogalacturonyl hydrolase YesR